MKYNKNELFSYTLGITLTFELLIYRPDLALAIYIHSKYKDSSSYEKLISLANSHNIEIIYSDKIFNILSQKENCFVIGKFKKFESKLNQSQNHIVLVNPSNTGNLGTIIRTAVGFNINNIALITPCVDIFDLKTVRASMGSIFNLNFEHFSDFNEYLIKYPNHKIYTFMLDGKENLSDIQVNSLSTLVFGNEATGLDSSFSKYNSVRINHSNKIDSLNLTIACSIAIYEFTKDKFKKI